MMTAEIQNALFPGDGEHTYAVVDGAACEELLDKLDAFGPEHACLYTGELTPDLAECAPYLVKLVLESDFTDWFIAEGQDKPWGIFAVSRADLRVMRKHLRNFLYVKDPSGQKLYFRYYDPRVFNAFLPTCRPGERAALFGPIRLFFAADAKDGMRGYESEQPSRYGQASTVAAFTLRVEQMDALSAHVTHHFVERTAQRLHANFPAQCARGSTDELRALIRRGIDRAESHGLTSEADVTVFLEATLFWGEDFGASKSEPWAATLLQRSDLTAAQKADDIAERLAVATHTGVSHG